MSRIVKWRRLKNILHRDVGYLIVGLTMVFGISGLALNHAAPLAAGERDVMVATGALVPIVYWLYTIW